MKRFFIFLFFSLAFFFSPVCLYAQFESRGLKGKYFDGRFLVYASDYALAEEVGAKVRLVYQKVIDDIGYAGAFTTKYQILIWRDESDFDNFLKDLKVIVAPETDAVVMYNFSDIPTIAGYWSEDFLKKNLPHEFTHLILAELLAVAPKNIPLWLNEGLATYESGPSLQQLNAFLKDTIQRGVYITLEELTSLKSYPSVAERSQLFYEQSQSFVGFLINRRARKDVFYSFLRFYVSQAYPLEKAYLYAYGEAADINKLQKEWIASVTQQEAGKAQ